MKSIVKKLNKQSKRKGRQLEPAALAEVQKLLEENPPNGAHVSAKMTEIADGFLSPELPEKLSKALRESGKKFYGNELDA